MVAKQALAWAFIEGGFDPQEVAAWFFHARLFHGDLSQSQVIETPDGEGGSYVSIIEKN